MTRATGYDDATRRLNDHCSNEPSIKIPREALCQALAKQEGDGVQQRSEQSRPSSKMARLKHSSPCPNGVLATPASRTAFRCSRIGNGQGGKVQLINAASFWIPLRKGLRANPRVSAVDRKENILRLLVDFADVATRNVAQNGARHQTIVIRVYPSTHFGLRNFTVERPLKLDFRPDPCGSRSST